MPLSLSNCSIFRRVGLAWAFTLLLVTFPEFSNALPPRPGLDAPAELFTIRDGIGKNFEHYRGRNSGGQLGLSLSEAIIPEPDPLVGNVNALVLMVWGRGWPFTTTANMHTQRLFSEGKYNDPANGKAGSVRDFYLENSHGLLSVEGQVWGTRWADFDPNNNGIIDNAEMWGIITQTLATYDPYIDYSKFDNDGPDGIPRSSGSTDDDGYIDMLLMVHSGTARQMSGDPLDPVTAMFPFSQPVATNDGVFMNEAALVPELSYYFDWGQLLFGYTIAEIGGVVHEMGHLFGLPDLYDVDGSSQGIGEWGLMGSGGWMSVWASPTVEYPGTSPTHLCSWSKYQLGWLNGKIEKLDEALERSEEILKKHIGGKS